MEKDERELGSSPRTHDSRTVQRAARPAPGKVTRTGKLATARGAAVQRKAAPPGEIGRAESRSSPSWTDDIYMDMAHRGLAALAERDGNTGGALVQRKPSSQEGPPLIGPGERARVTDGPQGSGR